MTTDNLIKMKKANRLPVCPEINDKEHSSSSFLFSLFLPGNRRAFSEGWTRELLVSNEKIEGKKRRREKRRRRKSAEDGGFNLKRPIVPSLLCFLLCSSIIFLSFLLSIIHGTCPPGEYEVEIFAGAIFTSWVERERESACTLSVRMVTTMPFFFFW